MTLRDISYLFILHLRERKIYSYITVLCTENITSYFTLIPALCQTREDALFLENKIFHILLLKQYAMEKVSFLLTNGPYIYGGSILGVSYQ